LLPENGVAAELAVPELPAPFVASGQEHERRNPPPRRGYRLLPRTPTVTGHAQWACIFDLIGW